jgi:hypothetical protein
MQRLIIFLGHPTYSLSVVLFALLLSSSLGSYSTQNKQTAGRLLMLLIVLIAFAIFAPMVISICEDATTPVRIVISIVLLFPLGFFMGMAFPLGMKLASQKSEILTPWLWGINGAMSVCASVLAVVIALNSGISTAYSSGLFCYVIAVIAYASAKEASFHRNQKSKHKIGRIHAR